MVGAVLPFLPLDMEAALLQGMVGVGAVGDGAAVDEMEAVEVGGEVGGGVGTTHMVMRTVAVEAKVVEEAKLFSTLCTFRMRWCLPF